MLLIPTQLPHFKNIETFFLLNFSVYNKDFIVAEWCAVMQKLIAALPSISGALRKYTATVQELIAQFPMQV